MNKIYLKPFLAFFGNLLDHYSTAMYCLCVPLIMPYLFPNDSLPLQLVKAFSLFPLTLLTKPLGAVFFGFLSHKKSPEFSLKLSYLGMAFASLAMSCLSCNLSPTKLYFFLICIRLLQGFFSSGETINGAIYVLDFASTKLKGFYSGLFDACSLAGYVMASILIYTCQVHETLNQHWRLLFALGGLTLIPAWFLKKPISSLEVKFCTRPGFSQLAKIVIVAGLSYAFFSLCFIFTNSGSHLFSHFNKYQVSKDTTYLFIIDLILLPVFGYIANQTSYLSYMKSALIIAAISSPIVFFHIQDYSIEEFFILRLMFTILGAMFSAHVFRFCKDALPSHEHTMALSLSFSIGSSLVGHSFSLIATSFYQYFSSTFLIGIFFSFLCLLGFTALQKKLEKAPKLV